jgi:hypothetical protein
MKINFFTTVSMFLLVFSNITNAKCYRSDPTFEINQPIDFSQKIYLLTDQIIFHDSRIFVQLNEDVIPVPAILSDQQGYYILKVWGCRAYEWRCLNPKCKKCVDIEDYRCPACGWSMDGEPLR